MFPNFDRCVSLTWMCNKSSLECFIWLKIKKGLLEASNPKISKQKLLNWARVQSYLFNLERIWIINWVIVFRSLKGWVKYGGLRPRPCWIILYAGCQYYLVCNKFPLNCLIIDSLMKFSCNSPPNCLIGTKQLICVQSWACSVNSRTEQFDWQKY